MDELRKKINDLLQDVTLDVIADSVGQLRYNLVDLVQNYYDWHVAVNHDTSSISVDVFVQFEYRKPYIHYSFVITPENATLD